jgi:hypothetical protein
VINLSEKYLRFLNNPRVIIEIARYVARIVNTGKSVIIGSDGKVIASTKLGEQTAITANVQPLVGNTSYSRFGDLLLVTISIMLFVLQGFFRSRKADRILKQYERNLRFRIHVIELTKFTHKPSQKFIYSPGSQLSHLLKGTEFIMPPLHTNCQNNRLSMIDRRGGFLTRCD